MATKVQTPQLTPNNRIYLYRLLSHELGCGKQTFMPAVEKALASDRMTAEDLGFESTRALLETLEEFIKLTVFKGGRIYATVIAQPAWDEALAALESGKAKDAGTPSNKPWKRKKADKTLKPARPKRVKRPEPAPEPEPFAKNVSAASPAPDGEAAQARVEEAESTLKDADADTANVLENDAPVTKVAETAEIAEVAETIETAITSENVLRTKSDDTCERVGEDPQPSPAISLTVTYDPYSGIDREMKLESHPVTPKPEQAPPKPACAPSQVASSPAALSGVPAPSAPCIPPAHIAPQNAGQPDVTTAPQTAAAEQGHVPPSLDQPAAAAQPAVVAQPAAATQPVAAAQPTAGAQPVAVAQPTAAVQPAVATMPAPLSPAVLATYPTDFSTEVYLSSERIADLCELLPYGTDVFTLLAEDYVRARALDLISGTRARSTFPLRIQHADSIEPIRVSLKKRSGSGLQWELSAIE